MCCVNSIKVYPTALELGVGSWYYDAYAEVCPTDACCKCVEWHSDNPCVASVNPSNGYIYANSVGVAKIYATTTDGSGCSNYINIRVSETVPVRSIVVLPATITIEPGQTTTLSTTVLPKTASNKALIWTSSNEKVAIVNCNGVVTGIAGGTVSIIATAADGSGTSDACVVKVTGDVLVSSITFYHSSVNMLVGDSGYLWINVLPSDATNDSVCWSSSDTSVVTVNKNSGLVLAQGAGTATIYATACDGSGVCGCCTVRVIPVYVQDIVVCPETLTLDVGEKSCLEATVYPVNATNPNICWVSGDCNIADVDSNGCVTGKAAGTTCICAYATDGSGVHGCCEVTCNIPSSGTDSIGVFQTLSTLSATPADDETEAPVILGVQFTEPQNGNYKIRFVSQIKTLNYNALGYEIHSKFGDAAPVSNILSSKVVYEWLFAGGEKIYPDEGFDYFVVGVVENIPENTVASFKIVPFAITLEGEFLYGDSTLLSCKDAQINDSVNFEIPEHLSTLSHIGHAELLPDKNNYTFTCAFSQCDVSFTAPKDQFIGSYVTSDTNPNLGNSQTPFAYGIDVSSHQGEISQEQWNEIANTKIDGYTITFAILRIGREDSNNADESINRKMDERFENNYARAKAAGLQVGCYYYTESWSKENAIDDAKQVIEWIGDKQFEYPVFFDIESTGIQNNVPNKNDRTEICTAFMNKMREAGFFAGLYTNNNWITNYLNSSTLFPEYDFWYARYYDNTPNDWQSNWAGTGKKFGMWQYTESKKIAPISGNVDCNVAYKNYPLIIKALHMNNFN